METWIAFFGCMTIMDKMFSFQLKTTRDGYSFHLYNDAFKIKIFDFNKKHPRQEKVLPRMFFYAINWYIIEFCVDTICFLPFLLL